VLGMWQVKHDTSHVTLGCTCAYARCLEQTKFYSKASQHEDRGDTDAHTLSRSLSRSRALSLSISLSLSLTWLTCLHMHVERRSLVI
jgi:hypothetical protein